MIIISQVLGTLGTLGLGLALLRLLGLTHVPASLLLGAGYGLGVVIVSLYVSAVSRAGAMLSTASWIVALTGLIAGAMVMWLHRDTQSLTGELRTTDKRDVVTITPIRCYQKPLVIVLLALTGLHLIITLSNNLMRPVFPWDAFTTWMYRAKAWVLEDSINTMAFTPDWIAAGGSAGYAIYASHYPTALSVYAAFMSALTGDWLAAAASVPWTMCLLAMCLLIHGALRMGNLSNRLALVGAYLLASLPLLNIHAALSGYGDLWIALLSGGGLALLLLARLSVGAPAIWLGLLLLIASTQIKSEGWLWLGLGLSFLALDTIARRVGYFRFLIGIAAVLTFFWIIGWTNFTLGPLGKWGLDDERLFAGFLGNFALRPYQPAAKYFEVLFEQANFLLLGGTYIAAMLIAALILKKQAASLWMMGLLIAISQGIIFGLSSYSRYAESDTAITRLLLQFTPVMIVSVMVVWRSSQLVFEETRNSALQGDSLVKGGGKVLKDGVLVSLLVAATLASPALVFLDTTGLSVDNTGVEVDQSDFVPVVGRSDTTKQGLKFLDSPINVGVLKASADLPSIALPRYLVSDVSMKDFGDVAFYWILDGDTAVQSVSLGISGTAIEDLSQYTKWHQQRVKELGYLVQSPSFRTSSVRGLALQNDIGIADFAAIVNGWLASEALNHAHINNVLGHAESPISRSAWFNTALLTLVALSACLIALRIRIKIFAHCGAALLALWLLLDLLSIRTSSINGTLFSEKSHQPSTFIRQTERMIGRATEAITEGTRGNKPVLLIALDESAQLAAQLAAFKLLPRAAAFTQKETAAIVATDWQGPIVLFGENSDNLLRAAEVITSAGSDLKVTLKDGFAIVSPRNE